MITGATGNVGSEVLYYILQSKFASLTIFCRNEEDLDQTARKMAQDPRSRIGIYEVDFKDPYKVTSKVKEALTFMQGNLEHIFFCHGVINYMGGIDGSFLEWDNVQKINVRSTMQILSICAPFLRQRGGSVSVLSSSAGEKPWPGYTIFNSAMASLNMMVRCAALENAQFNVRINAVAPGPIESDARTRYEEAENVLSADQNNRVLNQERQNTPLVGFV